MKRRKMMVIAINLLIGLYRAFPLRPHCDSRHDVHTFLCRMAMPVLGALVDEKPCPPRNLPRPPGVLMCGEHRSNRPNWLPNPNSH